MDNKLWQFFVTGGQLRGTVVNDAESLDYNWLQVNRTSTIVDDIILSSVNILLASKKPLFILKPTGFCLEFRLFIYCL